MTSKTEIFLPGIFRDRSQFLSDYLQVGEKPLIDTDKEMEGFTDKLLPSTCHASWLDWLFYALGGEDYNRDDFDETKKRMVLSRLFELYRTRGTIEGFKTHFNILLGRELLGYHQPPAKAFCGISLTQEEREQFESIHPEIRVYPFMHNGIKQSFFVGDCLGDPVEDYAVFPAQTDALLRIGDRIDLYDPLTDETTPLNFFYIEKEYVEKQAKRIVEVRLKGMPKGIFPHSPLTRGVQGCVCGFLIDHESKKRFYTVKFEAVYTDEIQRRTPLSITPSLQPFRTYYEEESVPGVARGLSLYNRYTPPQSPPWQGGELWGGDRGGSFCGEGYFVDSDAEDRIYKKLKLFDPSRLSFPLRQKSGMFLGAFRIGVLPSHHVKAAVDMASTAPAMAMYLRRTLSGYPCISDAKERIEEMRWSGNLARRAGCRVLVAITNRKPVRASSGTLSGNYKTGQYIEEVI